MNIEKIFNDKEKYRNSKLKHQTIYLNKADVK